MTKKFKGGRVVDTEEESKPVHIEEIIKPEEPAKPEVPAKTSAEQQKEVVLKRHAKNANS